MGGSEAWRRSIVDPLNSAGLNVEDAVDREAGLESARRLARAGAPVDVVLIRCEEVDSSSGLASLRAHPALGGAPLLVLTRADRAGAAAGGLDEAHPSSIVVRPPTPTRLFCGLLSVLGLENRTPPLPTSAAPEGTLGLDGARVLVADDEEINRLIVVEILRQAGVASDEAVSGVEALQLLRAAGGRYAAILLDLQMPGMDGYETARAIRRDPALADLPIIALTADAVRGVEQRCLDAGMDAWLSKPFDPDALIGVLRERVAASGAYRRLRDESGEWTSASLANHPEPARMSALPAPGAPLLDMLDELAGLLASSDMGARQVAKRIDGAVAGTPDHAVLRPALEQIRQYDFEAALELVLAALAALATQPAPSAPGDGDPRRPEPR